MKLTLAQLNPVVGDVEGNGTRLIQTLEALRGDAPDLVVFPELFLAGYPPRDLLEKRWFIEKAGAALARIQEASREYPGTGVLVGLPTPADGHAGTGLHNSAALVFQGQVLAIQHKSLLPTYDVFDEARYFDPAPALQVVPFKGEMLGISICEDAWNDPELWPSQRAYDYDPIEALAGMGATLFINISASPFSMGKEIVRHRLIRNHARRHGIPFVYVNQVGANDELIFDGRSLALDAAGDPILIGAPFKEEVRTIETHADGPVGARRVRSAAWPRRAPPCPYYAPQDPIASVHDALVLGIRDYARKCGFSRAVIGLSGGIDSALTCCLAAEALGGENVLGISMPSPYSSRGSVEDSRELARNLGVRFLVVPISDIFDSYLATLEPHFAGAGRDVTEENIQARIRGNILMAFSNKFGHLVLSTGNKSELAVGYCTLYGDMSGGLSVISDVPKTLVYELAAHVNRRREIIPRAIIEKPPSAELRPNQVDQDTLPPYPILDQILHLYVEEGRSADEIIEQGFDPETTRWVVRAVVANEHKRRQAAPGLRVTTKAFGMGRRMPIAARY